MIKLGPPVGCVVFLHNSSGAVGVEKLLRAFEALVVFGDRHCHEGAAFNDRHYYEGVSSSAWAKLGGEQLEVIVSTEKIGVANLVFLNFNEDEVVHLAREKKTAITELFMPYVETAKAVDETLAIALGFDLSAPSDLREQSLHEVGVALLFARDESSQLWLRRELRPMVGHYL